MANVASIDEYISTFPEDVQKKLEKVRQIIRKAAPEAAEVIKWSRPAFVGDTILVMFGGFKNHIGFYSTPSSLKAFEDDLTKFNTGKGSIQFPYRQLLPTNLIRKITEYRVWESREKGIMWKS